MIYKDVLKSIGLCFAFFYASHGLSHTPPNCMGFSFTAENSAIPNADFENRSCCSETITWDNYNGFDCIHDWERISDPTPDAWNPDCGGLSTWWECADPPANSSPSFVGIIYGDGWKEYIGSCTIAPLEAGKSYTLRIRVGFGTPNSTSFQNSDSPMTLTLYGNGSCNNLFFDGTNCPTIDGDGWLELGSEIVVGNEGQWVEVEIQITPNQNINAIAIGAPCGFSGANAYYFLDDLILTETIDFQEPISLSIDGDVCDENITLSATSISNINYQWYHNDNEINGATSPDFVIPNGTEGLYQVVLSNSTGCLESEVFDLEIPDSYVEIDTIICYGESVSIANNTYIETGTFLDTLTNLHNCDSIVLLSLTVHDEITYEIFVEEILCNGDSTLVEVIPTNSNSTIVWGDGNTQLYKHLFAGEQNFTLTNSSTGCSQPASFEIEQPEQLTANITVTDVSCIGNNDGMIEIQVIGGIEPYLIRIDSQLFIQESNTVYTNLRPNEYEVFVIDANGCKFSETVQIQEPGNPHLFIDIEHYEMNLGETQHLQLIATNNNANTATDEVIWSHSSQIEDNGFFAQFTADSIGTFQISATLIDINGCKHFANTTIIVKPDIFFPTAFSPIKSQGFNDTFFPQGKIEIVKELAIYSRWKNCVFKQKNFVANIPELGWDGRFENKVQEGVYLYRAEIVLSDGTAQSIEGQFLLIN